MIDSEAQILPLTADEQRLLARRYFIIWTVYKRMLGAGGLVFGALLAWLGWAAWHDPSLWPTFGIVGAVLAGVALPLWWMTTQYVARTVRPLRLDLAEGQKRVAAGTIIGLQTAGKYETELIFQPRSGGNPATFRLLPAAQRRSGNVFITGREAWAEYTPHAWLLLQLRLVVPLAPAEIVQQQAKEKEALGAVLLLVGLLVLGLGWWLDIFWPMAGIYMMAVLLVLGVVRYEKRQRRP